MKTMLGHYDTQKLTPNELDCSRDSHSKKHSHNSSATFHSHRKKKKDLILRFEEPKRETSLFP